MVPPGTAGRLRSRAETFKVSALPVAHLHLASPEGLRKSLRSAANGRPLPHSTSRMLSAAGGPPAGLAGPIEGLEVAALTTGPPGNGADRHTPRQNVTK